MNIDKRVCINLNNKRSNSSLSYSDSIDSVHCIVGKNGSGKTRLINDLLMQTGELAYISSDSIDTKKELSIVKFSASLELGQLKQLPENSFDVSTSSLLGNMNLINLNRWDSIQQVRIVIEEFKKLEYVIGFSNKRLKIQLTQEGEGILSFNKRYFNGNPFKGFLENLLEQSNLFCKNKDKDINKLLKVLLIKFLSIFTGEFLLNKYDTEYEEKIKSLFDDIDMETIQTKEDFYKLLIKISGLPKDNKKIKALKLFFKNLDYFLDNISNSYDMSKKNNRNVLKKILGMLKNDQSYGHITEEVFSIIEFQWEGLSSGELALLNLFSRLNYIKGYLRKNTLLLIDEVDLGMHPEWQRRWVNDVLPIIGSIFKNRSESIHLVLTTHSPIILSDILEDDIIYLSEEHKNIHFKTFGQNIYSLFKNSFYLEDAKGGFSMEVIKRLLSIFGGSPKDQILITKCKEIEEFSQRYGMNFKDRDVKEIRESFEKILNMIGEDIIRNHLQVQIENANWFGESESVVEYQNEIEKYKNKIRELELKIKNDKNN